MGKLVEATVTPATVESVFAALPNSLSQSARALLVAHWAFETGWWAKCYCWNLGNFKLGNAPERDWYEAACDETLPVNSYPTCTPNVTPIGDPVSGLQEYAFTPPHSQCRFIAFESFEKAVAWHLARLQTKFVAAWDKLQKGDPVEYALALKQCGYYTAPLETYTTRVSDCLRQVNEKLVALSAKAQHPTRAPDELAGDYIARCVRFWAEQKPTLANHAGKLALTRLAEPVEGKAAAQEIYRATNCATSAAWILAQAGCESKWVKDSDSKRRSLDGAGPVSWLRRLGMETGALQKYTSLSQLKPGTLVRYYSGGNNDHVEWILETPNANGVAVHAGGGRASNAITIGTSDIRTSSSRPIVEYWLPEKLPLPAVPVSLNLDSPETNKESVDNQPGELAVIVPPNEHVGTAEPTNNSNDPQTDVSQQFGKPSQPGKPLWAALFVAVLAVATYLIGLARECGH